MGLWNRVTTIFRRGSPEVTIQKEEELRPDATPFTHNTEDIRETDFIYRSLQVETNRRATLRDVELMLLADPLIDETNDRVARKAVRGGIFVTVTGSGKHQQSKAVKTGSKAVRGQQVANKAQQIIDDFMKRCQVDAHAKTWASRLPADGDLFLNVVVKDYGGQPKIECIRRTPPAIMKRNEDQFGQFIDLNRAYSEIDPLNGLFFTTVIPENAYRHFPLWAINHIRWKYRGGLYGNSQYISIRKLSKQNASADDDMVVRRKTRAPLRRAHMIGNKDNPGDPKVVEKYKTEHKDAIVNGKYMATTDYYMNGLGDVKNLDGDSNLDKIGDVEYLFNKQNTGTLVPKGLIGFAEDINRDVLDDQKEEYYDTIEDIRHLLEYGDGGPFSGLRAIINFELLLHGIDVETAGISYDVAFSQLRTEDPDEVVNRTKTARDAHLIDQRTAVLAIAHIFNVEDPELMLLALEEEKKEQQEQLAVKGGDKADEVNKVVTDSGESWGDEGDDEHLKDLELIESKTERTWKLRFKRIQRAVSQIELNFEETVTDAEGEAEKSFLNEEMIEWFMSEVASIQQDDWDEYSSELGYVYIHSGEVGGKLAAARVGLNFGIHREDILDDLSKRSVTRVKNIDETTEKQLRKALSQGYLSGDKHELINAVRAALGEVYAEAYKNRARMIARTESMWAYNESGKRIYAEAGYDVTSAPALPAHPECRCAYSSDGENIIVLVTRDERTCPKCKHFIGKRY
ncbi:MULTISPECIES: hypothetical protein [unclassified Paenibacillus]|uniref:hypothetical protein n=1 Tax=unclassified Paenibacillus TaxID=185978 RepID=UPI00363F1A2E